MKYSLEFLSKNISAGDAIIFRNGLRLVIKRYDSVGRIVYFYSEKYKKLDDMYQFIKEVDFKISKKAQTTDIELKKDKKSNKEVHGFVELFNLLYSYSKSTRMRAPYFYCLLDVFKAIEVANKTYVDASDINGDKVALTESYKVDISNYISLYFNPKNEAIKKEIKQCKDNHSFGVFIAFSSTIINKVSSGNCSKIFMLPNGDCWFDDYYSNPAKNLANPNNLNCLNLDEFDFKKIYSTNEFDSNYHLARIMINGKIPTDKLTIAGIYFENAPQMNLFLSVLKKTSDEAKIFSKKCHVENYLFR